MRIRVFVLATLVVVAACDERSVTTPAEISEPIVGLTSGSSSLSTISGNGMHISDRSRSSVFQALDEGGVTWVRVGIPWDDVQPSGPDSWSFGWQRLETVDSLLARGYQVLVVFSGTPSWARPSAQNQACEDWIENSLNLALVDRNLRKCPPVPEFIPDFERFVRRVSEEFPGVDHWEVWNETFNEASVGSPDTRGVSHFYGTVAEEDELIFAASRALGDGEFVVCCGYGSGQWVTSPDEDRNFIQWRIQEMPGGDSIDILSLHHYEWDGSEPSSRIPEFIDEIIYDVPGTLPIWLTEYGVHQSPDLESGWGTPAEKRAAIERTINGMASRNRWEASFYFFFARPECNEKPINDCWAIAYLENDINGDHQVDSVLTEPYCTLVNLADNVSARCFDVQIVGPFLITDSGSYTYHLDIESGIGDRLFWSFEWEYRPSGGSWQTVGTDSTYTKFVTSSDPDFELRATVVTWNGATGGASRGATDSDVQWVPVSIVGGGCPPPQIQCE